MQVIINLSFSLWVTMAVSIENTAWLRQLLADVQLEQFYLKLRDELQVIDANFFMDCIISFFNIVTDTLWHCKSLRKTLYWLSREFFD